MRGDRVSILWSARENQAASVAYSTDDSYSNVLPARVRALPSALTGLSYPVYQYQADITGLASGTDYYYRAVIGDETISLDSQSRFRTAGTGSYSFLVFGDSGASTASQTALTLKMVQERPDFVIHVGDIAYEEGTFTQFQARYFDFYATMMSRLPFFPTPGNHEYYTPDAAPYLAVMSLPATPRRHRACSIGWTPI
jgi:phosphodiesterase/alkaline phosphatase D-like protein